MSWPVPTRARPTLALQCLTAVAVWAAPAIARGEVPECGPDVTEWASECSESQEGFDVQPAFCPPGGALLDGRIGEFSVRLEVSGDPARGFREVAGFGVSVLGDFPDWNRAPPEYHRALDHVVECLGRDATLGHLQPVPAGSTHIETVAVQSQPFPWLVLGGLLVGLFVVGRRSAGLPTRTRSADAAVAAGLVLTGWVVGKALFPCAFLHQNGQGPLWVLFGLCTPADGYGPGFREVWGWLLGANPDRPEHALFAGQAILGALWPAWAFLGARALGASRRVALALAVVVLADPVAARAVHSETYFATTTSLLWPAGVLLVAGATGDSRSKGLFWCAVLGAGLLVAQVARMHPLAYLPCAFVVAPLLTLPGKSRRERIVRTAQAGLGIAAIVLTGAGAIVLDNMSSSKSASWTDLAFSSPWLMAVPAIVAGGALLSLIPLMNRRLGALWPVLLMAATCIVTIETNLVAVGGVPIEQASFRQYGPAVGLLAACALVGLPSRPVWLRPSLTGLGLVLALAWQAQFWQPVQMRATDQIEQDLWIDWRSDLGTQNVAYLGRADRRVLYVPLYGACLTDHPRGEILQADDPGTVPAPNSLYYHSSLCSTVDGQALCQSVEDSLELELMRSAVLPASESMKDLGYLDDDVPVRLYRVTGRRGGR